MRLRRSTGTAVLPRRPQLRCERAWRAGGAREPYAHSRIAARKLASATVAVADIDTEALKAKATAAAESVRRAAAPRGWESHFPTNN